MGPRGIVLAAVTGAAIAACGGSAHKSSSTSQLTSTPPPTPPRSGIAQRVLTNDELPGFIANGSPQVATSASAWLTDSQTPASQMASQTARLNRLGFVAAVRENLLAQSGLPGLSIAEQFNTAGGARGEFAYQKKGNAADFEPYRQFAVPGIPGALGFGGSGAGSGGINVAFVKGDTYYLVGQEVTSVTSGAERTLVAAARHLYRRVSY